MSLFAGMHQSAGNVVSTLETSFDAGQLALEQVTAIGSEVSEEYRKAACALSETNDPEVSGR